LRIGRNWIKNVGVHVPDGFFDAPTSVATGLIAAGAVGFSLQRANRELRETGPALAGLTAAFVFAVQMVNFPVGAGTSGHLLGGALAAALVGPWTAVLCMAVVLLVLAGLLAGACASARVTAPPLHAASEPVAQTCEDLAREEERTEVMRAGINTGLLAGAWGVLYGGAQGAF